MSKQIAIYPGTFDPITNGHLDLVVRATEIFETIIVAVADNLTKSSLFSIEERVELASEVLSDLHNVRVMGFNNLLIDFAKQNGAGVILRGLRAVSDFEYEFQLAGMNRRMAPDLDTMFLTPAEQHAFISSSLVREIAKLGGDVSSFVPETIQRSLDRKFKSIRQK